MLDARALDELRNTIGGDEMMVELVEAFLEDAPPLIAAIRKAAAEGNAAEVRRAAHSLKGNGRDFGAQAFADLCKKVEDDAVAGNIDAAAERADAIDAAFEAVRDELRTRYRLAEN